MPVARGSLLVLQLLAANSGARFSMAGFGRLVDGAKADETLQYDLATRQDLPPAVDRELAGILSEKLRQTLRTLGVNSPDALAPRSSEPCRRGCPTRCARRSVRRARSRRSSARSARGLVARREIVPLARGDRAYDIASIVSDLAEHRPCHRHEGHDRIGRGAHDRAVPLPRRLMGDVRGRAAASRQAPKAELRQEPVPRPHLPGDGQGRRPSACSAFCRSAANPR